MVISLPSSTSGRQPEEIRMSLSDKEKGYQFEVAEALGAKAILEDANVQEKLVSIKDRFQKFIQSLKSQSYIPGFVNISI